MTVEEQIEEILLEANAYNMRTEVLDAMNWIIEQNPTIDKLKAARAAFNLIVND